MESILIPPLPCSVRDFWLIQWRAGMRHTCTTGTSHSPMWAAWGRLMTGSLFGNSSPCCLKAPHMWIQPSSLRSQAFMAISVQQGEAPDVSTELESIYYLLIALCSISGDLYWQHSASGNSDAKVAAMFNRHTYNKEVRVQPCPHSRLAQSGIQQAFFSVIFQKASNWQEI